MNNTLVENIIKYSKEQPNKTAVIFRDDFVSYSNLYRKIQVVAEKLKKNNVMHGDKVMVTAVSKPEYVITYLAIQFLGAIAVPVDKNAKKDTVKKIYDIVSPKVFVTDTQCFFEEITSVSLKKITSEESEAKKDCSKYVYNDDDIVEILFTTGTTGVPKGAMLSSKSIVANIENTRDGIGMMSDDVVLIPLPLNHSFGMRVLRTSLYMGATVVLQNGFSFAKEIENNIEKNKCTALVAVPASVDVILGQMQDRAPEILGKLRYIEVSAGSLNLKQRTKLPEILPNTVIHNTWGSTESGGALFLNVSELPDKRNSIGKPLHNIELKVINEDGNLIEARNIETAGRMALRGEMQMSGYLNRPDETKKSLVDGWLVTNDMVYVDDDGYVYMLGRADDIINVGGEKVSPIEVENVAIQYEYVNECGCIGVSIENDVRGQIPVLFVVPNSGYSETGLRIFLSDNLDKYKIPVEYRILSELPRNKMGKLDRNALRVLWEQKESEELMNPVIQALLSRRSIRRFKDDLIPKEILEIIVKTGMYAPSGHNLQTWKFTVINDIDVIKKIKEATLAAAKSKGTYVYGFENPVAIVIISYDERNIYGMQDTSAATENIMIAATSFGIGSVWLNSLFELRNEEPVKNILDKMQIPKEHKICSMVALGYPDAPANMLAKKSDVIYYVDGNGI